MSISSHLFVLSSVSLISVLGFSEYGFFTSLVTFIPRCFIHFHAIVNGIVFLISLSDSSLLVHRNTTDFCIMILYLATSLIHFLLLILLLVKSLEFSIYSIMSSANNDSFTFSFLIWITLSLFFFFVWLLWLGLPTLWWIKVSRVGILVLFLVLEERLPAFHHYYISCGFAVYGFYYVKIHSFHNHFLRFFVVKGCWILSNAFSAPIEMSIWFLSLILLMWCITESDLQMVNHAWIPRINPTWPWCMILWIHGWIWFPNNLLRTFVSLFIRDIDP